MSRTKNGFTIVELLIVIVIIAILAVITIITFNGIQQRARNNAKISAATALVRAIDAYTISTKTLTPGIPVCLPTGNKDYNADGLGDCGTVTNPAAPSNTEKAVLNTALANAGVNGLSFPNDEVTATNGVKYAGIQITYGAGDRGMNGVLQPYFLYFRIEGTNQDCTSSYSVGTQASPDPLYEIVPARNYTYALGTTTCAFTIKHPNSL